MNIIFALILALTLPLVLLPIEHFFNYPYVLEELVKFLAICLIILPSKDTKNNYLIFAIFVGILFTISESMLYLADFISFGTVMIFPKRLFVTGILHISTCALMYVLGRKKLWLLIPGLMISILMHYYFNKAISDISSFQ